MFQDVHKQLSYPVVHWYECFVITVLCELDKYLPANYLKALCSPIFLSSIWFEGHMAILNVVF